MCHKHAITMLASKKLFLLEISNVNALFMYVLTFYFLTLLNLCFVQCEFISFYKKNKHLVF